MKSFISLIFMVFALAMAVHLLHKKPSKPHSCTMRTEKSELAIKHLSAKPIENLLRQTTSLCSSSVPTTFGSISNYTINNHLYSTIAEPGSHPLKNLYFEVKKRKAPFDDDWVSINTMKSLHNAAAKDGKLDYVLKISKRMHLPPSLAIVPIVESNFKNTTVSSKGAAGAWQLMPETARDYGLALKERYQLAPATKAALHFLKDLHHTLNNWELAFAAYNAGLQRVKKAIKKNPYAVSIEELDLPRETKEYVLRIKKINAFIKKFAHVKSNISQLVTDFEY